MNGALAGWQASDTFSIGMFQDRKFPVLCVESNAVDGVSSAEVANARAFVGDVLLNLAEGVACVEASQVCANVARPRYHSESACISANTCIFYAIISCVES